MLCGWEGNHRSGVALAMRHTLSGLSTYGLKGQCAGDEHPPMLHWSVVPFNFFYIYGGKGGGVKFPFSH